MIRRWGIPWYAIGIGGTVVFMAVFFITRLSGNPITGRGGGMNTMSILVEIFQAAFIALAAAALVYERRKKRIAAQTSKFTEQRFFEQFKSKPFWIWIRRGIKDSIPFFLGGAERIKGLFPTIGFDTKETVVQLNGVKIEAFPPHHLDAMRGLPNVSFILLDEADFFPLGEQQDVRAVSERYIAKSDPYIVMVSTPNAPEDLFEEMRGSQMISVFTKGYSLTIQEVLTRSTLSKRLQMLENLLVSNGSIT